MRGQQKIELVLCQLCVSSETGFEYCEYINICHQSLPANRHSALGQKAISLRRKQNVALLGIWPWDANKITPCRLKSSGIETGADAVDDGEIDKGWLDHRLLCHQRTNEVGKRADRIILSDESGSDYFSSSFFTDHSDYFSSSFRLFPFFIFHCHFHWAHYIQQKPEKYSSCFIPLVIIDTWIMDNWIMDNWQL